ncbi:hypothetical protein [Sphingomonas sp. Marseille-Q8236]
MQSEPEGRRELPVEVEFREGGNAADPIQIQLVIEMPVDMIQHPLHPAMVVTKRRRHRPVLRGGDS